MKKHVILAELAQWAREKICFTSRMGTWKNTFYKQNEHMKKHVILAELAHEKHLLQAEWAH